MDLAEWRPLGFRIEPETLADRGGGSVRVLKHVLDIAEHETAERLATGLACQRAGRHGRLAQPIHPHR